MIYRGTDSFAQTAAPSPLPHTWSLGIEEQFYWRWPLLLLALRNRRAIFVASVAGAAGSVLATAVWHGANRVYFGTDTRAQALLIGCALATVPLTRYRRILGACAVLGTLGTAWLWTHASGTDKWVFTVAALAVAAVLAPAPGRPGGPAPRGLPGPPPASGGPHLSRLLLLDAPPSPF